jgi:hypothetical protein
MMMKVYLVFNILSLAVPAAASSSYCVDEAEMIEQAPSPAPSLNLACNTHTSNARGRYTSTVAPCIFHFHKADSERELELIEFHTSDLCSDENSFLEVHEYVSEWPDECVGSFPRCYSLEHHRSVVWDFLCSKEWQIPDGTTHVSVDCTPDKELFALKSLRRREEIKQQEHNARIETYEGKLFNLALILGACLIAVVAISNLIVKPLVAASKDAKRNRHHVLPRRSSCDCDTCQEACTNTCESDDGSQGEQMADFDSQVPDFDAVPISPGDLNLDSQTRTGLRTDSSLDSGHVDIPEDFQSQEPDFDAIPIVPATILYN